MSHPAADSKLDGTFICLGSAGEGARATWARWPDAVSTSDVPRLLRLKSSSTHTSVAYLKVSCVHIAGNGSVSCAVRAHGITKCFGDVIALDGVDLDVAAGQIHGVVGPNGAGKTTMLGLLLGLAVADRGSLEILGTPVGRALAAPDGVAGFVDGPGLYPSLTARRNLSALAVLRGQDARTARIAEVLGEVG